jgi:hypothetical protein
VEEENEEAECDILCNTLSIQANLQQNITALRVVSRAVSVKGIDMALIQSSWYREGRIRGLNITGYTLFSAGRIDKPRSCTLTRNKTN